MQPIITQPVTLNGHLMIGSLVGVLRLEEEVISFKAKDKQTVQFGLADIERVTTGELQGLTFHLRDKKHLTVVFFDVAAVTERRQQLADNDQPARDSILWRAALGAQGVSVIDGKPLLKRIRAAIRLK